MARIITDYLDHAALQYGGKCAFADEKEELHRLLQKVYDDVNNCERKCKKC